MARDLLAKAEAKGVKFLLPKDVVVADKFAADAAFKNVGVDGIPDGLARPGCGAGVGQGVFGRRLILKDGGLERAHGRLRVRQLCQRGVRGRRPALKFGWHHDHRRRRQRGGGGEGRFGVEDVAHLDGRRRIRRFEARAAGRWPRSTTRIL